MSSTSSIETGLVTIKKTRRKIKLHPHKQRSKYICRPEYLVEVGNHFVWEFIPGHGTLNVPADAAILHHYRVCEFGGDDCVKSASTVDKTAYRYKSNLVNKTEKKFYELKDKCNLLEAPLPLKESTKKPTRVFKNAKDFNFFNFDSVKIS